MHRTGRGRRAPGLPALLVVGSGLLLGALALGPAPAWADTDAGAAAGSSAPQSQAGRSTDGTASTPEHHSGDPADGHSSGKGDADGDAHDETPLAITSPDDGGFVGTEHLTVRGTGTPGDRIQVSTASGGDPACLAVVDDDGDWECETDAPDDGPGKRLRATELPPKGESGPTHSVHVTVAVLGPPTITVGDNGGILSYGLVRGKGAYPGATVTATASDGSSCRFTADSSGQWSCLLAGITSGDYTVSARQSADFTSHRSASSPPVRLVIDADAPSAPVLSGPKSGTRIDAGDRVDFSGTGEKGAVVTVHADDEDGDTLLCTTTVRSHAWSCRGGERLDPGRYRVSALQRDEVGNVSPGSDAIVLSVRKPAPTPGGGDTATPGPGPSHQGSSAPPTHGSRPGQGSTPQPSPSRGPRPSPNPSPSTPAPGQSVPPGDGGGGSVPPPPGIRLPAHPLGGIVTPAVGPGTASGWVRSLLLAVIAVLLLAVPGRLLLLAVARRRGRPRAAGLFGRNRPHAVAADETAARRRWPSAVFSLVLGAVLLGLSVPMGGWGDAVRLTVTGALALLVVNAAAAVPVLLRHGRGALLSALPQALLLVAATALLTRMLGLEPALLFGLLSGLGAGTGLEAKREGRIEAARIGALVVLGLAAWFGIGALPHTLHHLGSYGLELGSVVVLLAIGSATVGMLPLGPLPGRAILAWSRPAWFGTALAVTTLLFALLIPVGARWEGAARLIAPLGLALLFACGCLAVWVWRRYVQPSL